MPRSSGKDESPLLRPAGPHVPDTARTGVCYGGTQSKRRESGLPAALHSLHSEERIPISCPLNQPRVPVSPSPCPLTHGPISVSPDPSPHFPVSQRLVSEQPLCAPVSSGVGLGRVCGSSQHTEPVCGRQRGLGWPCPLLSRTGCLLLTEFPASENITGHSGWPVTLP